MASNITANTKAALVAGVKVIRERISTAISTYQASVDTLRALAGVTGLPMNGNESLVDASIAHKRALAQIYSEGRRILDPVIVQMGREAGYTGIDGETPDNWPRLFRKIQSDLAGGTPDFVTARAVTFASNPSQTAKGIFRRLTVDHAGQKIEDGFHNQTKTIRVVSKPARYQSTAEIRGGANTNADALDYRSGRPRTTANFRAINDATAPSGSVLNPYLTPSDVTDEADITSIANWTITTTGTPVFKAEATAANLWRSRAYAVRFTGDNTEAIELVQNIPAAVLQDGYRPWDIGVPIKLESGWQGTIDITWGGKTQQFTHSDLTAGSYVHLFPDLDLDLFPVNFDATGAQFKVKFTNGQNNTQSIWCAGFLPQAMVQHEGIWYSHWSHADEPEVEDEVTIVDTCTFDGRVQDVVCFLYHEIAPGWAHLASSGTATIVDPTWTPEIGITRSGSNVADGGSIALGTVSASSEHTVTLRINNTGNGPLAIAVPVDNGSPTNATLTTAGLSVPAGIGPGEWLDVTVGVTDGGAGAFSLTIRIDNNDASEGTYEITISGTAA